MRSYVTSFERAAKRIGNSHSRRLAVAGLKRTANVNQNKARDVYTSKWALYIIYTIIVFVFRMISITDDVHTCTTPIRNILFFFLLK